MNRRELVLQAACCWKPEPSAAANVTVADEIYDAQGNRRLLAEEESCSVNGQLAALGYLPLWTSLNNIEFNIIYIMRTDELKQLKNEAEAGHPTKVVKISK